MLLPILFTQYAQAQQTQTISYKPGPTTGQDVSVWYTTNNCAIQYESNRYTPAADANWGGLIELHMDRWTYNAVGCPDGRRKFYLRFTALDSLAANTNIISAHLKLKTPGLNNRETFGNSAYLGSNLGLNNQGYLKRVLPGLSNSWDENILTWNNSQNIQFDAQTNWINIPVTNAQLDYVLNLDVTPVVRAIHQDIGNQIPNANNGFVIELQNYNEMYTAQLYASSEHPDENYRPELVLVVETDDCIPDFSISSSSLNPLDYTFTAIQNNASYQWRINNNVVGYNQILNYSFQNIKEKATVCLTVYNKEGSDCEKCVTLFGETSVDELNAAMNFKIFPNPAYNVWTVKADQLSSIYNQYQISDISGKIIETKSIVSNEIKIGEGLQTGFYILELIGSKHNFQTKLIKL